MHVLPRQLLGPLAIALALAFQLVAAPVASAQRAPRAKATKTSKAAKAAKIRTQRTAPRRLAAKRSASTSLRLRGAAKSTTRSSLARPKAVAGTKARPIQAQTRARAAKPASKNVPPKDGRWHKPLKALKGGIAKLKANPQVVRLIKFSSRVSAKMTRTLDGWQARAPPLVARTMSALRTYSLPSIAAYTLSRVKNDKAFLGSYLVAKSVVSNLVLPGAIAIGMDPVLATILSALTAPVTVGVVVLRERHIRNAAGESISVKDTAKLIGREYRDFAKARKAAKSAKAHAGVTSSPVATTSAATTSAAALAASR